MLEFLHLSLTQFIETAGYIGIFAMVFAESGLPFGFIFPGDTLLFAAGLLAAEGYFNIVLLAGLITAAAIAGDNAGYWLGSKLGPLLFSKEDSFIFNKKHIERAEAFYRKYGPSALILARFIPVVRTFVPILAGVAGMQYAKFVSYNVVGGILWGAGITVLGYFLGSAFPETQNYLLPAMLIIIVLSSLPVLFELFKKRPT